MAKKKKSSGGNKSKQQQQQQQAPATTTTTLTDKGGESTYQLEHHLPRWHYFGPDPSRHAQAHDSSSLGETTLLSFPPLTGPRTVNLGNYSRRNVSNIDVDVIPHDEVDHHLVVPQLELAPPEPQQQQQKQQEEVKEEKPTLQLADNNGSNNPTAIAASETEEAAIDNDNSKSHANLEKEQQKEQQKPKKVTNFGRQYFDMGLRLMLSYQHEMAAKCFLAALQYCPDCCLAHGLVALCHSPNYNFKGEAYYESACHYEDVQKHDLLCVFPSQQVADRHSQQAMEKIERIKKLHASAGNYNTNNSGNYRKKGGKRGKGRSSGSNKVNSPSPKNKTHANGDGMPDETTNNGGGEQETAENGPTDAPPEEDVVAAAVVYKPALISDVESIWLAAIRVLTCCPGIDPGLSDETVGRPFANAMRSVYQKYPHDPDVAYCFAESLMVLNAWQLFEYPSGRPVSPDVLECQGVLETALQEHPLHAGLCHMYVHLSEMSAHPELALTACGPLRTQFPHAGHLIHMPTHIDVLIGDYESCIHYNQQAVKADLFVMACSPATAGKESFYFGYIVHNYHMAVYGAVLGAMEEQAMMAALELNEAVNETMFQEYPDLVAYLESYSALEIHVMIRFGRWKEILEVPFPADKRLMLFRTASIRFARGLAFALLHQDFVQARKEADRLDTLRRDPDAEHRILHNNTIADLLAVDAVMLRGEIAYREGNHEQAFTLLRKAVQMQDNLNYDEPWGKMQPIRHALGGLLLEQGHVQEAEAVFRKDLRFHPKNPWALSGLIRCLQKQLPTAVAASGAPASSASSSCCCAASEPSVHKDTEIEKDTSTTTAAAAATTTKGEVVTERSPEDIHAEIVELQDIFTVQRQSKWADYKVVVPCACCQDPEEEQEGTHIITE